jgi:hypothetical protein
VATFHDPRLGGSCPVAERTDFDHHDACRHKFKSNAKRRKACDEHRETTTAANHLSRSTLRGPLGSRRAGPAGYPRPYDFLLRRQWSFSSAVDFILANHATLINDNLGDVAQPDWPQLEKLARLSGYRFVLREISHAADVAPGQQLPVAMKWSNVGVGRLYRSHRLVLYLLDATGKTAHRQPQQGVDPSTWLPGDYDLSANIEIPPSLSPGTYTLAIALVDPATEEPAIRLAIDVPQTNRIHHLSRVQVR